MHWAVENRPLWGTLTDGEVAPVDMEDPTAMIGTSTEMLRLMLAAVGSKTSRSGAVRQRHSEMLDSLECGCMGLEVSLSAVEGCT